jgi:hypothetical protein
MFCWAIRQCGGLLIIQCHQFPKPHGSVDPILAEMKFENFVPKCLDSLNSAHVSLKFQASSHLCGGIPHRVCRRYTKLEGLPAPMQATKRSSFIISWKLKILGFNNFSSRQQPSFGGKQQLQICCDGKSHSAMSIGVQDEKNTDC